jgi:hypothetical protein
MVGRKEQVEIMLDTLKKNKSSFVAVTGRRRVGKTYLIDQVYAMNFCFKVTGIQNAGQESQIVNFTQKIVEYSKETIVVMPENWQQVFILLRRYLTSLSKKKKQVIFIDELPWIATVRSGFIQYLAHLWNDYLSKEKHFILVVCGSATSWITKKIVNDKGGFHNRITDPITLLPFTLSETKQFLLSKNINLSDNSIAEIYMAIGGIPFYLENIRKGESPSQAIERMCFTSSGILKNEYDNLYKALFENAENHEQIVATLASASYGLSRQELLLKTKIPAGGSFSRALKELIVSGFVYEEIPFRKQKRGTIFRLMDEFSVFYHRFIKPNKNPQKGIWTLLSNSQSYRIWLGYAFENLCFRHIDEIKKSLGISGVYTQPFSFKYIGENNNEGFQIDLGLDRKDDVINLIECKFYSSEFEVSKDYANKLLRRKTLFKEQTKTRKNVFVSTITNFPIKENQYSLMSIDSKLTINELI